MLIAHSKIILYKSKEKSLQDKEKSLQSAHTQTNEDKKMQSMINNPRDRGQIIDSMARGMALTQCYRDATSAVLRALGVTDGDFWFANEEQAAMARAAGDAACQKLQAKFDAEDAPIIAAQAAAEAQAAQAKRNTLLRDEIATIIKLNAGWYMLEGFIARNNVRKDEFTNEEKQALLALNEDEIFSFFGESRAVVTETNNFIFVESVNAEELKAARKAAKQAEKAAKIAAKKGRI